MEYLTYFLDYYKKVRQRTNVLIEIIPAEMIDWSYKEGKFTIGEMLKHIALIERLMYVETLCNRPSKYVGEDGVPARTLSDIKLYMKNLHEESLHIISQFSEAEFHEKCTTPVGVPITRWKWMRAMVEHEIHHRGQLYLYLNMLDVKTPPMYQLSAEELRGLGVAK